MTGNRASTKIRAVNGCLATPKTTRHTLDAPQLVNTSTRKEVKHNNTGHNQPQASHCRAIQALVVGVPAYRSHRSDTNARTDRVCNPKAIGLHGSQSAPRSVYGKHAQVKLPMYGGFPLSLAFLHTRSVPGIRLAPPGTVCEIQQLVLLPGESNPL